jgi:uncharacterized membrane protein
MAGEVPSGIDAEFPAPWDELAVFVGSSGGALVQLGLASLGLFAAWLGLAGSVSMRLSDAAPYQPEHWVMLAIAVMGGLGAATTGLVVFAFSVPRLIDGERSAAAAVRFSVNVCVANPRVVAFWGLLVGMIVLLSIAMGIIGLAVTLPVCAHATWHLYCRAAGNIRVDPEDDPSGCVKGDHVARVY